MKTADAKARLSRSTIEPNLLLAYAQMAMEDLDRVYGKIDLKWVKAVIATHRAIAMGEGEEKQKLAGTFRKTLEWQYGLSAGSSPTTLGEKLLGQVLGLDLAGAHGSRE